MLDLAEKEGFLNMEAPLDRLIEMGASDGLFWSYCFLPKTFSLSPGTYHHRFFEIVDDTSNRYISISVFRDGAKTTMARSALLRRICYGVTHTGLVISETKEHSASTLDWVRKRITEPGSRVAAAYGLEIGAISNTEKLEIVNKSQNITITILAQGITGQVRGINLDDFRPDTILLDDVGSDENMATEEQRDKIAKLVFGTVENSLAAKALNPHAQIINITTRHHNDDIHGLCRRDPRYKTFDLGVFDEDGNSTWESKWTTEELLLEKQAAIARNMLSTWMREKENTIIKTEQQSFVSSWLSVGAHTPDPSGGYAYFIAYDPAAPPSERQLKRGLKEKDYAVFSVLAAGHGEIVIVEQVDSKVSDPNWEIMTFFQLFSQYSPLAVGVESVAYQRTFAHTLRNAMQERRVYIPVLEITDPRAKFNRINDEFAILAYEGMLSCTPQCNRLITSFSEFPGCDYFDHLDSGAIGIMTIRQFSGGTFFPESKALKRNPASRQFSIEQMIASEEKEYGSTALIQHEGLAP